MTIAVFLSEEIKQTSFPQLLLKWAEAFPDRHYILISFGKHLENLPPNCTPVKVEPQIKNRLTRYYWFNFKLPAILNRYNVSVFISTYPFLRLKDSILQILYLENLKPAVICDSRNYRYYRKAVVITTTNPVLASVLQKKYKFPEGKIKLLPLPAEFNETYKSDREPYFTSIIYEGNHNQVITLLKAFSIFKKLQKSSFKLMLINHSKIQNPLPELNSYKFRSDVEIMDGNMQKNILNSAYAFIDLADISAGISNIYEALKYGKPVISTIPENEILKNIILFSESKDSALAEKMMHLYRNENAGKPVAIKELTFSNYMSTLEKML